LLLTPAGADCVHSGALRFSVKAARRPNSLRSNMGASSTASPCDARRALSRKTATSIASAAETRAFRRRL